MDSSRRRRIGYTGAVIAAVVVAVLALAGSAAAHSSGGVRLRVETGSDHQLLSTDALKVTVIAHSDRSMRLATGYVHDGPAFTKPVERSFDTGKTPVLL